MNFPNQSRPVHRKAGVGSADTGVEPSGCNIFKAAGCAIALAACGAVCVTGAVPACVSCLGALGAGSCIDCL
ncbi:hypothetical protein [Mesorhizobium sp. KR9-304]|uniref:hypothetical protein n=1 Tax=Mesorhizobium sp. KR9-304 TaxID=3156614 RepID=UPI0032B3E210